MKSILKKTLCLTLALLLAVPLFACSEGSDYPDALPESTEMPPEESESGETAETFETELYFLSESGNLASETTLVSRLHGQSRAEAAVAALMEGPVSSQLTTSLPEGLSLVRLELSGSVANILLSGMFPTEREWLIARAALAATVCGAEEGIEAVNVYLEGQEPGYRDRALGAMEPLSGSLDSYLAAMKEEYEPVVQQSEAGHFESRSATLYFQDQTGSYLIASLRTLSYSSSTTKEALVKTLLDELMKGAVNSDVLEPVLPASLTVQSAVLTPVTEQDEKSILRSEEEAAEAEPSQADESGEAAESDGGECIATVVFSRPENEAYSERLMCGSIVLTLTGYLPELRGVIICYQEEDGSVTALNGGAPYTRSDFEEKVGHLIRLAFPESDGSILYWVERAVSQSTVYDPEARLKELFHGPADPGVLYPVFEESMVSHVYTVGELVVVNWEKGFTENLEALIEAGGSTLPTERREQLFLFGVINTLTEIPGFSRVWMLENGKRLGTVGRIYLGNSLLNNPGLMVSE